MYTCERCSTQLRTRQGLAGHTRFRHGGRVGNVREPKTTREKQMYEVIQLMAAAHEKMVEEIGHLAVQMTVIAAAVRRLENRL